MCRVKWCVWWSDILSEVMFWVKRCVEWMICWVKWCVEWRGVLGEMICFIEVMFWVKWYSCFICRYSSSYFLEIFFSLPTFLSHSNISLPTQLHQYISTVSPDLTQTHHSLKTPPDKWSAQHPPPIPTIKPPQTHTSDRSATGIGVSTYRVFNWVAACLVLCNTNWLIGYCV